MTDDLDEYDLRELTVHAFLHGGLRLLSAWGFCGACNLTATTAVRWCGVTWAICSPCRSRWPVPDDGELRPELEPVPDDQIDAVMELLADCHYLPSPDEIPSSTLAVDATIAQETFTMRQHTTAPQSFGIDPQKFQLPRDLLALHPLTQRFRIMLTDVILRDMIEHSPFGRHPVSGAQVVVPGADMRCWHRVRSTVLDTEGHTFDQILHSDPAVSPFAIRGVMELFGRLRTRRAELEEQLHDLDAIEAVFSGAPAESVA